MPTPDWIRLTENGFYCDAGDFFLDPHRPARRGVISHAHGDHYPRSMGEVWCTPATLALARSRYGKHAARTAYARPFGTEFSVGEVTVKFFSAGHILGSAQILLTYRHQKVLYTGDFSLRPNPTCEPFAYGPDGVDLLICESTFGEKPHHGAPRAELQRVLEKAGPRPLLIGAYPLGKAQHLHHLLEALAPERTVFLHHEMMKFHKIYRAHGMDPGSGEAFRRVIAKRLPHPYAYLVPPRVLTGYDRDFQHYKVFATGWTASADRPYLDDALDLSDHADATDILAYVAAIQPRTVWFWHGYPGPLIAACTERGIPAIEASIAAPPP